MPDCNKIRKIRMKNEYERLMTMSQPGGIMEITGNNGPESDRYTVIFRIPTIIGFGPEGPEYRAVSTVDIFLPPEYPRAVPRAVMREAPPWHPNWYRDGRWDSGKCHALEEPLWEYVRRMAENIRFNPYFTNPNSPSNAAAAMDWNNPDHKRYFPTCDMPLPEPERSAPGREKLVIHRK